MKKGDIILIPFPFTDLTGNKNRPALVLAQNELDVTIAFISTQIYRKEDMDILLQPDRKKRLKKRVFNKIVKIGYH